MIIQKWPQRIKTRGPWSPQPPLPVLWSTHFFPRDFGKTVVLSIFPITANYLKTDSAVYWLQIKVCGNADPSHLSMKMPNTTLPDFKATSFSNEDFVKWSVTIYFESQSSFSHCQSLKSCFTERNPKSLNINVPLMLFLYNITFLHVSIYPEWQCCQITNTHINVDLWHTEKWHQRDCSQH